MPHRATWALTNAEVHLHDIDDAFIDPVDAVVVGPPREQNVPAALLLQHLVPDFHPPACHTSSLHALHFRGAEPLSCLALRDLGFAVNMRHAALHGASAEQAGGHRQVHQRESMQAAPLVQTLSQGSNCCDEAFEDVIMARQKPSWGWHENTIRQP